MPVQTNKTKVEISGCFVRERQDRIMKIELELRNIRTPAAGLSHRVAGNWGDADNREGTGNDRILGLSTRLPFVPS